MAPRDALRAIIDRVLAARQLSLVTTAAREREHDRYRRLVDAMARCLGPSMLPNVSVTDARIDRLSRLIGTDPVQGLFILDRLAAALAVAGDVCEFGVAQGATSALLAGELITTDRALWLYDSFQGLPQPSDEDELIDDVLNLGSMAAYEGAMAFGPDHVRSRLAALDFPRSRTRIVEGYVRGDMSADDLPSRICFVYIDFDLYEPIRDALRLVHERLSVGGSLVIDDYGFLSSGAKKAADEFFTQHPREYMTSKPPPFAGHFIMADRVR